MPHRFVILHHQSPNGEHWDVMLETDSALSTWSIPPLNTTGSSFACSATRLPDHRKHYLDYEGNIDGNRGRVFRVDMGIYEELSPNRFFIRGKMFSGVLTIENDEMSFEPEKTRETCTKISFTIPCPR